MGASITVYNGTSKEIELTYRSVGYEDKLTKKIKSSEGINIERNGKSKTLIFSIDNKAFRAVKMNQIIHIREIENDLIIIDIASRESPPCCFPQKYKERVERDLNWNFVCFNDEYRKDANKIINMRNDITEAVGNFLTDIDGKLITGITRKFLTGIIGKIVNGLIEKSANNNDNANKIINHLKVSEIEEKTNTDPNLLENIKRINNNLIKISWAIEIEYLSFKKENQNDNTKCTEFVINQLRKMTEVDMLHDLDSFSVEEAIPVYIYALNLAFKILNEIRLLNENRIATLEENSVRLYIKKFELMWSKINNDINKSYNVKIEGFICKSAEFRHQGQLIYKVRSKKKNRIIEKIDDIKNIFIKNREYQLDYMFNHPYQLINEWKNKLN